MSIIDTIPRYWKAVMGFLAPAAVVISTSVLKGSDGGSHITQAELITALCAAVLTSGGVALVPNRPKPLDNTADNGTDDELRGEVE